MPKKIPSDLKDRLLQILASHPEGLKPSDLEEHFLNLVGKRTLQRQMKELVSQGRVKHSGRARGIRYRLTTSEEPIQPTASLSGQAGHEGDIPLSPTGAQLQLFIRRPITKKIPVGYNREFLDDYRPNETAYLNHETRQNLHRLGRTPEVNRPAGTYARQILQRLLVDLSWASSRLEGNTYSLLDTERLITHGQAAQGKDASETQMILNHKSAIEFLVDSAGEIRLTPLTIRNLHALLSDNLLPDPSACGRLRHIEVAITGSVFIPLAVPQLLEECFRHILEMASAIADPFEQAFFLMVQLPYLQPFDDVNKRVSRLAGNLPLIQANLCPLSFVDVPERAYVEGTLAVYELNRIELLRDVFIWAYERSCQRYAAIRQSLGEPDLFRLQYREQLKIVVRASVQRLSPVSEDDLLKRAKASGVEEADLGSFVQIVKAELLSLNEGNFARYQIRPVEFEAWAAMGNRRF